MTVTIDPRHHAALPRPRALLELLKPVTWFPPMWAFACGLVSVPAALADRLDLVFLGVLLCGPLVCGTSQVVNDWYDRHVDAINEPHRPIPSGRMPGRWGLWFALVWTALSMAVAWVLGPWVFAAAALGMALAWAYSAPPLRLKLNGWWGNAAVGFSYETLPWFTAAAVMAGALPDWRIIAVALLYGLGAHGIMTLNDFKAVEGDRKIGIRSLPVQLGVDRAARLACWVMALPQLAVAGLLISWGQGPIAVIVLALVLAQYGCMRPLLDDPKGKAPWYNATGVTLYVSGMMLTAVALRGLQ